MARTIEDRLERNEDYAAEVGGLAEATAQTVNQVLLPTVQTVTSMQVVLGEHSVLLRGLQVAKDTSDALQRRADEQDGVIRGMKATMVAVVSALTLALTALGIWIALRGA